MSSLSYYNRYVKHLYYFPWSEHVKWLRLLRRFHCVFASYWEVRASIDGNKAEVVKIHVQPSMSTREFEKYIKAEKMSVAPSAMVKAVVAGTAFWGAMPASRNIFWTKLPANPSSEVPEYVEKFAEQVVRVASIVGDYNDVHYHFDWSAWNENRVPTEWFPHIVRKLRETKGFVARSLFYAPSIETMYVLIESYDADLMVVKFDGYKAWSAADVPFDLDDGFSGDVVPDEMNESYYEWRDVHDRNPAKPLLKILDIYSPMALDDDDSERSDTV